MKTQQFDPVKWPQLTAFRDACLARDYELMSRIAEAGHSWYENENPERHSMAVLASVYRVQHYAGTDNLEELRRAIEAAPWTINFPWTAQGWLPLTQAAVANAGHETFVYLFGAGADPALEVGDPDQRLDVIGMARYARHDELADWLAQQIASRESERGN